MFKIDRLTFDNVSLNGTSLLQISLLNLLMNIIIWTYLNYRNQLSIWERQNCVLTLTIEKASLLKNLRFYFLIKIKATKTIMILNNKIFLFYMQNIGAIPCLVTYPNPAGQIQLKLKRYQFIHSYLLESSFI